MDKPLLTLTLVAFLSFANVVPNLARIADSSRNKIQILRNSNNPPTVDSMMEAFNLLGDQVDLCKGQNINCVSDVPSDYKYTPGKGAYKFHNTSATWNTARKICLEEGGQLAILNSEEEAEILVNWMEREDSDVSWLGVHDQYAEGDWVTLKGETLEMAGYDKWNTIWSDQPDNSGGNENCGVFVIDSDDAENTGLGDVPCDWEWTFFCELDVC